MKFHSLIAASLLLLAVDSGATLLRAEVPAAASAGMPAGDPAGAHVYQNGDLVLDIRDSAGAEILRAGLSYFFCDEHIATANELPAAAHVDPVRAAAQPMVEGSVSNVDEPLPEPLSLGLLGAGIAVLGWTRRQEGWAEQLKRKLGLPDVLPWPALCWLD